METLFVPLLFVAVIATIFVGGRWNTSDADHYMGFDNLRGPRKRKAPNGGKNANQR